MCAILCSFSVRVYCIVGKFRGVQFSRKASLQSFCSLIFVDGRVAPHESHTIEATVRGYHVYKEIWLATVGEELSCLREVENYCNLILYWLIPWTTMALS